MRKCPVVLISFLLIPLLLAGCRFFISINIEVGSLTAWVFESTARPNDILVMAYDERPNGYRPLANALVELRDEDTYELETYTYTDSTGKFTISSITGRWVLVIRYPSDNSIVVKFPVYVRPGSQRTTSEPTVHYVIIGIDRYKDIDAKDLDVSVKDANLIKQTLVDENRMIGSYRLLTNEQATKARIKAAIIDAVRLAKPEDSLVVYFSGYADKDIWYGGVANPLDHLVPYDGVNYGSKEQIRNSMITDGDLEEWLRKFPNKNVTVILDVAYAQTFFDGVIRSQSLGEIELLALKGKGYTVLGATAGDERNFVSKGRYSLFTYCLVKGIEELPYNRITAHQLYEYAVEEIEEIEEMEGFSAQNPKFEGPKDTLIYVRSSYYW